MLIYLFQQIILVTTEGTQLLKTTEETKTNWCVKPTLMWLLTAGCLN